MEVESGIPATLATLLGMLNMKITVAISIKRPTPFIGAGFTHPRHIDPPKVQYFSSMKNAKDYYTGFMKAQGYDIKFKVKNGVHRAEFETSDRQYIHIIELEEISLKA